MNAGNSGSAGTGRSAGARRRIAAQAAMELRLLLRNGENLLVTLGIPLGILVFFSLVPVLPTGGAPGVDFLVPGVLTVSIMGSAMVSLGIATGFERSYLVLKRLGATPLRRWELVAAKALAVLVVEVAQVLVVVGSGLALGWRPDIGAAGTALAVVGVLFASAAFAGLGLILAGRLPALGSLAAINALFLFLLLVSGLVFPLDRLPDALRAVALVFPPAWLAEMLRAAFLPADGGSLTALLVLGVWAVAATTAAARLFRWE